MKVLKIGAVWCSGCLVMRSRWQEIEKENPWLKTEYIDFDEQENIVKKYNIDGGKLPVFIFLDKKGKIIKQIQGEPSKKELIKLINQFKNK
ncbi:thioredoxin family protein [Patescibacteria group bacterium]